jgi:hypothetical protein
VVEEDAEEHVALSVGSGLTPMGEGGRRSMRAQSAPNRGG